MDQQEIQTIQNSGTALIDMANAHIVLDQGQADEANEILIKLNRGLKQIEEKRKTFIDPINQARNEINSSFKKVVDPIKFAKDELTSRLMAWREKEQARIRAEREKAVREEERRQKIKDAHEAKGHKVKEEITPVAKPMPFSVNDTTKIRKDWKHEVENEALVPREYLIVNGPAITAAVRAGVRDIPGVKIYQKETAVF